MCNWVYWNSFRGIREKEDWERMPYRNIFILFARNKNMLKHWRWENVGKYKHWEYFWKAMYIFMQMKNKYKNHVLSIILIGRGISPEYQCLIYQKSDQAVSPKKLRLCVCSLQQHNQAACFGPLSASLRLMFLFCAKSSLQSSCM